MKYVICIDNSGYEASFEKRKVYEVGESESLPNGFISVLDESGEIYLYENNKFLPIELSSQIIERLVS